MQTGVIPMWDKKESAAAYAVYVQSMGQPVWSGRDYAAFAKEGYTENAVVFRCIRLIAEACKSIPLMVHDDSGPVDKHPFLDLIAYPNPSESISDVLDSIYSFLMISGNAFLEQVSIGKAPRELYSLRADRMKVTMSPRGRPAAYIYTVGGVPVTYDIPRSGQWPIMHLKTFHPLNDIYGLSPIEPAAKAIDTHNAALAFNASMLQNMGRPSGALMVKGGDDNQLTNDQFMRLKNQVEESVGPQRAGKPLLLEGGLEWVAFSQTPQDMEFMEGKNSSARDIALALGVPPQLLGIPGDNTYSNLKEANLAFYRQTVIPMVIRVCHGLSIFFRPTWGEQFKVWFDMDQISGLAAEREEQWKTAAAADFITVNEKRELVGFEERPEGDVILVSTSTVPLDEELDDPEEVDPAAGGGLDDGEETDTLDEDGGSDETEPEEGDSEDEQRQPD